MTATREDYISDVLAHLPSSAPLRTHIEMDLRSHITERLEQGQPIDEIVRKLGDPATLAVSYLSAVPLVAATFWDRAGAKLIDSLMILAFAAALGIGVAFAVIEPGREAIFFVVPITLVIGSFGFVIYTIWAEARSGQTIGKRLLGLRVVQESGARISLGQAFVRQLPIFLQIFAIDVLFALFTEKSQRGFEMISKTRVVRNAM
jgi:uncharacterized RDD family membrane protein YckC